MIEGDNTEHVTNQNKLLGKHSILFKLIRVMGDINRSPVRCYWTDACW